MSKIGRLPVGISPHCIWRGHVQGWIDTNGGITMNDYLAFRYARIKELGEAINRYLMAGERPLPEWGVEMSALLILGTDF